MADTKELVAKRKEAYKYIKDTLHQPPWHIPLNISDAQLADVLGGTHGLEKSLHSLREGKANPTRYLVDSFKDLVKQVIAESEINQYLIDPFK